MSGAVSIRSAAVGDMAGLLALERACDGAPHWSEDAWCALLQDERGGLRCVLVAEIDESLWGFIVVGGVAGVAELESVVVSAARRGQGIGRQLCETAMRWARERGAVIMELEVRAGSGLARGLYASLGFVEQGVRRGYYRDPLEDAVLMSAVLAGPEDEARNV